MAHFHLFYSQFSAKFSQLNNANRVFLTPNKRLSRFLTQTYSDYRFRQGHEAFSTLASYSFTGWVQLLWQNLQIGGVHPKSLRVALTPAQEQIVWESIIESHPNTPPLLNVTATAKLAQEAWRMLHQWQLDFSQLPALESGIFIHWCESFHQFCDEKEFISSYELPGLIAEAFESQIMSPPEAVHLYGFDEYPSDILRLLQVLDALGVTIDRWDASSEVNAVTLYECEDENEEMISAAIWARSVLMENPNATIGIVAPDLAKQRAKIERVFTKIFDANYVFPGVQQYAPGFNISAGQPLAKMPAIDTSLLLLKSMSVALSIDDASRLLRSPFIGVAEELANRALVDVRLRDLGDLTVTLQQLKMCVLELKADNGGDETLLCPNFYQGLNEFEKKSFLLKGDVLLPSEWAKHFSSQLHIVGWPGARTLDSLEYQQVNRWLETLENFSGLDHIVGEISITKALHCFSVLLQGQSFQAQTETSPIQILGVLEAAGLPFDDLWVLNMDDETWPPAPSPNPLLPVSLQIEKKMPQSSAERELDYAATLTQRFYSSSSRLHFSYAKRQGDKHLRLSSLIKGVQQKKFDLAVPSSVENILFASQNIEASLDNCGPSVANPDEIRGGSQILKSQAACPFQAFARYRLNASEIPEPKIGLSPLERGNLVHRIMEVVWRKLRNQNKLLQMSDYQLSALIDRAIDFSVSELKRKRYIGKRLLQIESKRLAQQIRAWLELEKQRAPFTVIFNEGRKTVKLNKLPIQIRYDRVDKLNNGRLLVLDYKTGKQNIRSWEGERPNEPQVPLYAIANSERVAGAAFGQICADSIEILGIADEENIAPGLKAPEMLFRMALPKTWQEILFYWRQILERLALEFLAGNAAVDPKTPASTCRYCELQSLCRIGERFNLDEEQAESEVDDE